MFSDYQMQEMSENFIDSFGFQDNEFTESDMNVRCEEITRVRLDYVTIQNRILKLKII